VFAEQQNEAGGKADYFAFCECRKKHIVGIIKGQKYYITDISQVALMFPCSVYESWDNRFWQQGYPTAFQLQDKLNYQRANAVKSARRGVNKQPVHCELCNVDCSDP